MTIFATLPYLRTIRWRLAVAACLLMGEFALPVLAYPPALPHTFYGMVRDELGNPLPPGALITLEAASGVKVYGVVSGLLEPGVNYRLQAPLDAGLISSAYKPTALNPAAPFKIKIKIGSVTYLPIEMSHDFAHMGEPGKTTRLNLTLGEDSNNDGLPDAWQRRINPNISQVAPGDDADHDGLTNMQEYLAGTYAYDSTSGFSLGIVGFSNNAPILAFTAITGRTYTILGSSDLNSEAWAPVQFRMTTQSANAAPLDLYLAPEVSILRVEVITQSGQTVPTFFKLMLK
jgi:hypothetical protein